MSKNKKRRSRRCFFRFLFGHQKGSGERGQRPEYTSKKPKKTKQKRKTATAKPSTHRHKTQKQAQIFSNQPPIFTKQIGGYFHLCLYRHTSLLNAKSPSSKTGGIQSVEKVRNSAVFFFFIFNFYVGVFGALPPFPTSFLDPKKEAKKESAAAPLAVFRLKPWIFNKLNPPRLRQGGFSVTL